MKALKNVVSKYSAAAVMERGCTSALIVERGARLLGLFVKDVDLLWVNPDLESVLERGQWNTGGLRLWVSPERSFFYEDPERFEGWFCPASIDPGQYRIVLAGPTRVVVEGVIEATDRFTGYRLHVKVRREFRLLSENRLLVRDVALASYSGDFNLWALAQVDPGVRGVALVPVRGGAQPIHYFGPIPPERLAVSEDHVSFKIDGARVCKLGVRPEDLPVEGSAAIAHIAEREGGTWTLLLMRTHDAPRWQEECLDQAKADPAGPKGCVQSYNSGPEAGPERFGEIELHFRPAIDVGAYKVSAVEYELIFAAGSREHVLNVLRVETGVREPKLL